MITCSVIVPVHNEEENIEKFLMSFWNELGAYQECVKEIHLIENGSSDNTFQVCQELAKKLPAVIPHHISFQSYGEAIKQGLSAATGDVVCILECDIMDVAFLSKSLALIEEDIADFVVASKRHPESVDCRPLKRRILTLLFNLWLKFYFDFPGTDTHGLKAIRADVAKSIHSIATTGDEVYQTEIVLLAHQMGYRLVEVPIRISETRNSNISIHRRLPKVIHIISDLKRSLARF